jgi:Holliday junction resolvase-like predicted endonuclease
MKRISFSCHTYLILSFLGCFRLPINESKDENFEDIQVIDLSEIIISSSEPLKGTFNRVEGNGGLNQRIIGDIGEEMVYKYLQKKYSSQTKSVSIKWENEYGESNLPYDILLIKNRKQYYIEVKSTRKNNEHQFPLSINQIEAIFEHQQYYSIYRVYTEKKKLIILDNIRQWLQKQHLHCLLAINSQLVNKIFHTTH